MLLLFLENNDNRVGNLEIELKNKIEKIKNLNPEACYNFSELNDNISGFGYSPDSSQMSKSVLPNESQKTRGTKDRFSDGFNPFLKTSNLILNKTGKTILNYKIIIKWLDIIASVLIILGCILSQIENEKYYQENKQDRIECIRLISDIYFNITNPLDSYNISKLNDDNFRNKINLTDYKSIPVAILISDFCNNLRYLVLILTLISIPLIIISRYIEYRRDYLYKLKSESKLNF